MASPAWGEIQIDIGEVVTRADAFASSGIPDRRYIYTIPGTETALSDNSRNATTLALTSSGGTTLLTHDIEHEHDGSPLYSGAETDSAVHFTAPQNLAYSLSGTYSVTFASSAFDDNLSSVMGLNVTLYDKTDNAPLFSSRQSSTSTVNNTFTLGGDFSSDLMGILTKDHEYYLSVHAYVNTNLLGNSGVTAIGDIRLSLVDPSAVPEPTQLAVWLGLGLCGAVGYRLRGRAAAAA